MRDFTENSAFTGMPPKVIPPVAVKPRISAWRVIAGRILILPCFIPLAMLIYTMATSSSHWRRKLDAIPPLCRSPLAARQRISTSEDDSATLARPGSMLVGCQTPETTSCRYWTGGPVISVKCATEAGNPLSALQLRACSESRVPCALRCGPIVGHPSRRIVRRFPPR
jgi:hypothetical protein